MAAPTAATTTQPQWRPCTHKTNNKDTITGKGRLPALVLQRPVTIQSSPGAGLRLLQSTFTLAALIIGHHLSISAFCQAPSASGVSLSLGGICKP